MGGLSGVTREKCSGQSAMQKTVLGINAISFLFLRDLNLCRVWTIPGTEMAIPSMQANAMKEKAVAARQCNIK